MLRLRTFSKAYGLAGIRCGYAIGPARLIGAFDRVRNHFGVSSITQAAAIAALADQDHLQSVLGQTARAKARIADIARDNGLLPLPSATNFVTIDCGHDGTFALVSSPAWPNAASSSESRWHRARPLHSHHGGHR